MLHPLAWALKDGTFVNLSVLFQTELSVSQFHTIITENLEISTYFFEKILPFKFSKPSRLIRDWAQSCSTLISSTAQLSACIMKLQDYRMQVVKGRHNPTPVLGLRLKLVLKFGLHLV